MRRARSWSGCSWVGAMLLLCAACGGATAGDAARGSALFNGETSLTGALKCAGCHAVDPAKSGGIGPNLSNIGNRAATTIQGMDAREYLRQSIVAPDAYLARGYQEGIHPRDYGKALTQQQIDDLIAYMLTLKSDRDSR